MNKYADDTVLTALITDDDDTHYCGVLPFTRSAISTPFKPVYFIALFVP